MDNTQIHQTIEPLIRIFFGDLLKKYLAPIHRYLKDSPSLVKTAPGFLIKPDEITFYVGRTHIAIEYLGPEYIEELPPEIETRIKFHDYSKEDCNLLEKIVGFEYNPTVDFTLPLMPLSEDWLLPTNRGWEKLSELRWNFVAQDSIMGMNTPCPRPVEGIFSRIVNGMFFDADESGLKTRRIKWLDFIPVLFDGSDDEFDSIGFSLDTLEKLVEHDANYSFPVPDDFKYIQLPKINKFIEIWGSRDNPETSITSYLADPKNEFILTMKFGAKSAHSELTCIWQSEDRKPIRPDFFIVQPNGYADIVEFKLPDISRSPVVGTDNRESFAAWLNGYISQTRVYSTYFDDYSNRKWFEKKYGFKVHKPKRWLIVGRRSDFDNDTWREIISDYRDVEILTFDDLIDGTVVQFYK